METRRTHQRVYTASQPTAHLGSAMERFPRDFFCRCVASFFTFLLFCVTATFVFFLRFTSTVFSRIKTKIISERSGAGGRDGDSFLLSEDGEPLRPILDDTEFEAMFPDNPGFKFQFRFDIPEDIRRNMGEQNEEYLHSVDRDHLLDTSTSKVVSENNTSGFTISAASPPDNQDFSNRDYLPTVETSVSNYKVVSEKNISGFVKKPQASVYMIQEAYVVDDADSDLLLDSEELDRSLKARLLSVKNCEEVTAVNEKSIDLENQSNPDDNENGISETSTGIHAGGRVTMDEVGSDHANSKESEPTMGDADTREPRQGDNGPLCTNGLVFKEDSDDTLRSDIDSLSLFSNDAYSVKSLAVDSDFGDGFLSEGDFDKEGFGKSENINQELMNSLNIELGHSHRSLDFSDESKIVYQFNKDISQIIEEAGLVISHMSSVKHPELEKVDELSDELEELEMEVESQETFIDLKIDRAIKQPHFDDEEIDLSDLLISQPSDKQVSSKQSTIFRADNYWCLENNDESLCQGKKSDDQMEDDLKFYEETDTDPEKIKMKGDCDNVDAYWEEQDIIDEISMELLNVRSNKLPTIPEELQSPYLVYADLKDWKFEETLSIEKTIDEIRMLYKNYRDSMKKLDILNDQKMHAIDVLKLKIPHQPTSSERPSVGSFLSQSFNRRKSNNDHLERLVKEVRSEQEIVYVGQTCLSWEFLWWQFEKSQDIPETDSYRYRHYNQVFYEFQGFQVLIQRFLEDEPFQIPRVPYYVKIRRGLALLQVPLIQEDGVNEKKEIKKNGDRLIMIEELNYMMAISIQAFSKFVKADKSTETSILLKGFKGHRPELQDPSDLKLLMDIQADLHKKERKLKDLLRVGNCLVKKFKKPVEDRTSRKLFFSQVDLMLISRVLEMPRLTTDQLIWCFKKLSNITFVDRKIHRESNFLLFPCSIN